MTKWLIGLAGLVSVGACTGIGPTEPASRFEAYAEADNRMTEEGRVRITAFLEDSGSSSALVLYQGKIAYQYGDIHEKHLIHSMRKAILGTMYGALVEEGAVGLDERVGTLGLDEPGNPLTEQEAAATVRELLQSRSGIYLPSAAESEGMTASKPDRGAHLPGEAYYYNNWSFNALGTLYEERAGESIYAAFEEQLAGPLGMTSWRGRIGEMRLGEGGDDPDMFPKRLKRTDGFYLHEPEKSRHPAYHFRLSAHDLGLFGQMLAQDGVWDGEGLVSAEWINEMTDCASVTAPDIGGGMRLCYGMMWTVTDRGGRTIAFSHTGLGTHLLSVHPGSDLVIVHRAPTEDPEFERKNPPSRLIGLVFGAFE